MHGAGRLKDVRTAQGRDRRASLLSAAQQVFEELGYFDTRVADIVGRAGVGHGTFYSYFESKDDVLHALVDELVELTFASSEPTALVPPERPWDQLRRTIAEFMRSYGDRAGMLRVLGQAVSCNPTFLARKREIRARFNGRIEQAVGPWLQRNQAQSDGDARHLAIVLGGMIEDAAYSRYVLAESFDDDVLVDTLTNVWAAATGMTTPQHGVEAT